MFKRTFKYILLLLLPAILSVLLTAPQASACNNNNSSNGNWSTVSWIGCNSTPPGATDSVTITGSGNVTLDQDVTVNQISPLNMLHASSYTLTLTATEPIVFFGVNSFDAGTSTVKLSDADHSFKCNIWPTFYNLQWATPITAPRTVTINTQITIAAGGALNIDGTPTNPVTLAGTGNFISAVRVNNCAGKSVSMTNVTCNAPPASQTITFNALPNKTFGDAPFTLSATASSGLAVAYAATGNCTVAGDTVTLTGVGSCTITASQGGNGSYLAATNVVQTFSISEKVNTPSTPSTPPLPDYLGLFLQIDGTGHGKVTTDTGLSCQSSDCQVEPKSGDLKCNPQACTQLEKTASYVTLTPQADADSVFSSWGGNEDCVDGKVFMNSGILCIAYFHRIYSLTVAAQGPGQVTGYSNYDPQPLIECGSKCQTSVSEGTRISLQATPSQGMTFSGWSGDCGNSTQTPLTVAVNKEMKCLATFVTPAPVVTPTPVIPTPPVVPTTPVVTTPPVVTPPAPVVTTPVDTTPPVTTPPVTATPGNVPTTSPTTPVETPPVTPPPVVTTPVATTGTTVPVSKSEDLDSNVVTTPPPVAVIPVVTTPPVSKSEDLDSRPVVVTLAPVVTLVPVTIAGANYSCATTGNIGEVCNYGGREVTNLDVLGTGIVSNGLVTTTVVNTGWVSNFHITAEGQLSGGVVTGYIKNEGIMRDFDFKGMSVIGGTLGGVITNTSRVGGYFQDVTLLPNTKITGGILSGIITGDKNAPAILENVRVKGRSKLSGVKLGKNVKLEKGVLLEDKQ